MPLSVPRLLVLCCVGLLTLAGNLSASALVSELAAGRARKVVVYGTSLTASGPWVGQMQSWLSGNYSGALTLINSGLSGKNSADGVAQLSSKVLAHQPDTVFLEFAMNDAFLYSDGTPQLSVEQARTNLLATIDAIRGQNPRVEIILQTMNSVWNSPAGSNESATLRPNLPAYYQMVGEVAAERGLLLVDHYPNWLALQTNQPGIFESYVPDGVHPVAAGTQAVVLPVLQKALIGAVKYHPANAAPTLLTTDVCVYGGTSGAVMAAVQVARMGKRTVLISPDAWLGGLSSNGLGWTDIGSPDAIGGLAREYYRRLYHYYLNDLVWTRETRSAYISRSSIDPDTTRQMMFTFEPKVARQVFEDFMAEVGVTVVRGRLRRGAGGVQREGRLMRELITDDGLVSVRAAMFIDATYEGDLMAAAGVSYTVGREPNSLYSETLNGIQTANSGGNQLPNGIDPYVTPGQPASGLLPGVNATAGGADGTGDQRLQAYTFRMCLTNDAGNRVPVPQPADYQESDYELLFRAIAAGQTSRFFKTSPMPNRKTDSNNDTGFSTDFIGGNYDLAAGWNYAEASYAQREQIIAAHIRYQQGFVWTVQNSPRVPSTIRNAWSSWGLPLDEFTETGGWPGQLYVREARRLVGDFVVTQRHVNQETGFVATDSIGMGGYAMDSHHTQRWAAPAGVKNEGDVQVAPARGPYGISYRAIVPRANEVENLLVPVALSASHIAYGSIRMEPVFMILGQSAGAAAVRAIEDGVSVQQVSSAALQRDLRLAGQVLSLQPPPATGEIIVDNSDATGITLTGEWTASSASPGYYGSNYLHDSNTGQGTKSVRFTPNLPQAGTYEVFGRWATNANRATNVRYDIIHAGGTSTAPLMNQQTNNGVWVSLGTYSFAAGTGGSVLLRNDAANGFVIADAVRFLQPGALAAVAVIASSKSTEEGGGTTGAFTIFRDSPGTSSLAVQLTFSGTATAGSDYPALATTVSIPAGSLAVSHAVPAFVDAVVEGSETVVASVAPHAAYRSGSPASATVTILDPPFDRWKATYFAPGERNDPQIGANTADPDFDGRDNALEFALGGHPRQADVAALPALSWHAGAGGPELRLYYAKPFEDLAFEVEHTPALQPSAWTRNGVSPETYDPAAGLFFQSVPIAPTDTARFLRLQSHPQ